MVDKKGDAIVDSCPSITTLYANTLLPALAPNADINHVQYGCTFWDTELFLHGFVLLRKRRICASSISVWDQKL